MTPALDEYHAKRDFATTPEPSGRDAEAHDAGHRFVIQEHHARSLHWDLRLEHDGTLASWAVPKGVPQDPKENHLAVRTEDHPLEYLDFHGEIPRGRYGAGSMTVWDHGTFEAREWSDRKVVVTLRGTRVHGTYALFATHDRNWMIHRMDQPDDPARERAPSDLRPMLATPAREVPPDDGWAFEMKWDGVRALVLVQGGRPRATSRLGNDITAGYPELRALGEALGSTEVLLDGELVAIDDEGRPSFQRLQQRMHSREPAVLRRLAAQIPVVYMIFDVVWLDGTLLTARPYVERREQLEALRLAGPTWQTPPVGRDGAAAIAASARLGFEGVVAKRLDSHYEAGHRSPAWRKVKHELRQELVIGGWEPGNGAREGRIGALLLGYWNEAGELVYAGKVGTGFTGATLDDLQARLGPLEQPESPFLPGGVPRRARFVQPTLVAEVRFTEWTDAGRIRQSSYLGLRDDVLGSDVVREAPTDLAPGSG